MNWQQRFFMTAGVLGSVIDKEERKLWKTIFQFNNIKMKKFHRKYVRQIIFYFATIQGNIPVIKELIKYNKHLLVSLQHLSLIHLLNLK